jgi:hypothetical protein
MSHFQQFRDAVCRSRSTDDLSKEIARIELSIVRSTDFAPGYPQYPGKVATDNFTSVRDQIKHVISQNGGLEKIAGCLFMYSQNNRFEDWHRNELAHIIFAKYGSSAPAAGGASLAQAGQAAPLGAGGAGGDPRPRPVVPFTDSQEVLDAKAAFQFAAEVASEKDANVRNAQRALDKARRELDTANEALDVADAALASAQQKERAAKRFKSNA